MATNVTALKPKGEPAKVSIAEGLLAAGKLTPQDIERAQSAQAAHDECLEFILAKLGMISERDLAGAFAAAFDMPVIGKDDYPDEPLFADRISAAFLRRARVLPLHERDGCLGIAMADPGDEFAAQALSFMAKLPVDPVVGLVSDIDEAIRRLYRDEEAEPGGAVADNSGLDDAERLRDLASEAPIIRLVDRLIREAVGEGASDIHIEPLDRGLRVRYRIDGVLRTIDEPPAQYKAAIVSRVKILARLNIAERRLPQDGRLHLAVDGRDIDFRVSTSPTVHGESVVLRILDKEAVSFDFESLGFSAGVRETVLGLLTRPHGIVLVTGPTGSGKTTTLYAALTLLNAPGKKILTVEDPVEYTLEGINQVQVQSSIGRGFAGTLRSFLRQDPDIIMVGEIRDVETARVAVQAALTGHLVLSTVHTNDAASAVTRLLDMGVDDYLIASTLIGVLGQRLVRTLCPACRAEAKPSGAVPAKLGARLSAGQAPARLYRPVGCEACGQTGYKGRAAIAEALSITEAVRARILARGPAAEIAEAAVGEGMRSMYADGLEKASAGTTSIEEVLRVTSEG